MGKLINSVRGHFEMAAFSGYTSGSHPGANLPLGVNFLFHDDKFTEP